MVDRKPSPNKDSLYNTEALLPKALLRKADQAKKNRHLSNLRKWKDIQWEKAKHKQTDTNQTTQTNVHKMHTHTHTIS